MRLTALALGTLLCLHVMSAQAQELFDKETFAHPADVQDTVFGFGNGSTVVAPIPLSNPTVGSGLILGAGYLFNVDSKSDTSFFGLGALRTDNGTEGYALAGNFAMRENRLKFGFAAGAVNAFYPLYVGGVPVQINQSGELIQANFAYGFTPDFAAGLHMRYIDTTISPKGIGSLPLDVVPDTNLGIFNIGLTADYDTRDDTIFANNGFHVAAKTSHGFINGDSRTYDKVTLVFDYFTPAPKKDDVFAFRVAGCSASDSAPFYDACAIGGDDAFRGYPSTQFIDNNRLSVQAEYRGKLSDRFGYALFGGVGVVGENGSELLDDDLKSAVGLGLRFRLSKQFPLDFAIDAAVNRDGEQSTYVYVGQRF
ncbi:MAG: BamA/TamA family outer membrane protein [Pseudoruegeria sp.]